MLIVLNKNCTVHMYSLDTSVVVANKVFGLGIDVDNVRSIIHIDFLKIYMNTTNN